MDQVKVKNTDRDSQLYSQMDSEIQAINIVTETNMFEDKEKSDNGRLILGKNQQKSYIYKDGDNVAKAQ